MAVAIAVTVLVSVAFLAYLNPWPPQQRWLVRTYAVVVDAPSSLQYTILAPVAVLMNGTVAAFLDNMTVKNGNVTFRFEQTPFGPALNLTGRGGAYLSAQVREENSVPPPLSGTRHPNGDVDLNLWTAPDDPLDAVLGSVRLFVDANGSASQIGLTVLVVVGDVTHVAQLESARDDWQSVPVYMQTVSP